MPRKRREPDAADTPQELGARALRLLARREHSREELARKLAPHADSVAGLEVVLDALQARKQLSDDRYAEARAHQLSRKYGVARIEADLRAKSVSEDTIHRAVAEARETEPARAREAWRRRFGRLPASRQEFAKQARFLQSRGFSLATIRQVLKSDDPE